MKLVAFGVAVVLLLTCNGFGSHARSIAPARVTSLYKSIGETKQNSVGDILRDCSKDSDKMKIKSISVSPDPLKAGDYFTIKANVTFSEKVTSGEMKVNLVLDNFPLLSSTVDLCNTLSLGGLPCPISAGPHTFSLTAQLPDETPTGNITGKQYLYDENKNELACIDVTLKL